MNINITKTARATTPACFGVARSNFAWCVEATLTAKNMVTSDLSVIVELAVQLEGFKNINLFSQGVYQVRVRATAEHSGRVALPVAIHEMLLPPMAAAVNTDQLLP